MIWFLLPLYGGWFWIISAVLIIWFSFLVFTDEPFGAFGILFLWIAVFFVLGDLWKLFAWMLENPVKVLLIVIMQFLLGFIWSISHWAITQYQDRSKYNTKKIDFLRSKGVITDETSSTDLEDMEIPDIYLAEWKRLCGYNPSSWSNYDSYTSNSLHHRRRFNSNKKRIANRILYWEVSLLLYLFGDFLAMCCRAIVEKMRKVYQNIEDSVWSGTERDFREVKTEEA